MVETIVAGVDGHEAGRDALALSGVFASVWDARVVAVRVHAQGGEASQVAPLEALLHRDAELELAADLARTGVAAEPRVTAGVSAARTLHRIAAQEEAELIVVGAARHDPEGVLGVAASALHGAPCPVAVAPQGSRMTAALPTAIVVGLGDEPETAPAVAHAIALARRTGASLTLLCVVALPPDLNVDGAFFEDVRERSRLANDALAQRLAGEHGVAATALTVIGTPEDELVRLSRVVDLVVVGSQRATRTGRPAPGRMTEHLVHRAACPVLVVPAGGPVVPSALHSTSVGAAAPPAR